MIDRHVGILLLSLGLCQARQYLLRSGMPSTGPRTKHNPAFWLLPGTLPYLTSKFWQHHHHHPRVSVEYQVYHLEPSVAVASQFMDHRVRHGVFRHILDWCGAAFCLDDLLLSSDFDALTPADQIREVLRAALVARHGPEKGLEVSASLG